MQSSWAGIFTCGEASRSSNGSFPCWGGEVVDKNPKTPLRSCFSEKCYKIKVVGRGRFMGAHDLELDLRGHGGRREVKIAQRLNGGSDEKIYLVKVAGNDHFWGIGSCQN